MNSLYGFSSAFVRAIYDRYVHTPAILEKDEYFPEYRLFEQRWPEIREECLALMREIQTVPQFHELMQEQEALSKYGDKYWRMFVLRAYGVDNRSNQTRCPATAALLRGRKNILSATISFLEGNKHIPAHHGPFRGILRFHLGLVIPKKADGSSTNRFMIDGKPYSLQEGGTLLWDDSFEHEVWNDAGSSRAALLLDVARPGMPLPLAMVNWLVLKTVQLIILLRGQRRWTATKNSSPQRAGA